MKWTDGIKKAIDEIAEQNKSPEGRKQFRADGGPERVHAMIHELDALKAQLYPFQ